MKYASIEINFKNSITQERDAETSSIASRRKHLLPGYVGQDAERCVEMEQQAYGEFDLVCIFCVDALIRLTQYL